MLIPAAARPVILRPWRDTDLVPFAAMNADPEVMRFFPAPLSRAESDAFVGRIRSAFAAQGWGLWALEITAGAGGPAVEFGGFVGLARPSFDAHFTPCVEIGWRLARPLWGRGYAPAAAAAVLDLAFSPTGPETAGQQPAGPETAGPETAGQQPAGQETATGGPGASSGIGLTDVVSMTTVANLPSRRVMEKLGMTRDPAEDFDHPRVPADSPLRRHVLYRIDAPTWHRHLSQPMGSSSG